MTQTDQMNQQEVSFRSDEQAQSQDRERLQSEIQKAWRNLLADRKDCDSLFGGSWATDDEIRLLEWRLGL
jgi:hypothetical protein